MTKHHVIQLPGRHAGAGTASQIERDQRQRRWLAQVDALFDEVHQWLLPYAQDGRMQLTVSSTSLLELFFGRPLRRTMAIRFNGRKAMLRPVAPLLPGERGHVALAGPRGQARLSPSDTNPASPWRIAYWDGNRTVHVDLTEDAFFLALLEATSD